MKTCLKGIRVFGAALGAMAMVGAGHAQLAKQAETPMTKDALDAAILGIEMEGFSPSAMFEWRECIDPDGVTLYETPAGLQNGKVSTLETGEACFAYDDDDFENWSCFRVTEAGGGLVFRNGFGDVFITRRITRGVRSCEPLDDLIG